MAEQKEFHLHLPASEVALGHLAAALGSYAAATALPPRAAHHLLLLAEELASNVVLHGTAGTTPASCFSLAVQPEGAMLRLVLEDDGPAFDPLARPAPDLSAGLAAREAGGLGLHLVRRLSHAQEYHRLPGRNRLSLLLDASG